MESNFKESLFEGGQIAKESPPTATLPGKNETIPSQERSDGAADVGAENEEGERVDEFMSRFTQASLTSCIAMIVVFLLIGVIAFSLIFEGWSFVDSLYFSVVTFTTVGYGDLTPTTQGGRLFTVFYALAGIAIIGIALGVIAERLVESQMEAMESAINHNTKNVINTFDRNGGDNVDEPINRNNGGDNVDEKINRRSSEDTFQENGAWSEIAKRRAKKLLADFCRGIQKSWPIIVAISVCSYLSGVDDGWTLIDTIYFGVITSTTIGYGDLVPDREIEKVVSIFCIPILVGAFGYLLGSIAVYVSNKRLEKARAAIMERGLTSGDFEVMDADGNGEVSEAEFVEFMLVSMQKVDQELLDKLHAQFHALDQDSSGTLDGVDLKLMVKERERKKSMRGTEQMSIMDRTSKLVLELL